MSAAGEALRVGVVGTGHLGRHHTRILSSLPGAELVGIVDRDPAVAQAISEQHGVRIFPSVAALAPEIEAAVVAVPTVDHLPVSLELLAHGVHLLVEKPIAPSVEEADKLVAAAGDRVVAVGHVEFANPAVQALLKVPAAPRFVETQRLSGFSPRSLDIDVLLDLMIHDIQVLHAMDPSPIADLRATGIEVLSPRIDIANVRIELESGCVANLTASRVSSEPVRKLRVFFPERYYSVDYREQEIKGYRLGSEGEGRTILPDNLAFEPGEPLRLELEAFVEACRGRRPPLVSAEEGRRALATALSLVEAVARR